MTQSERLVRTDEVNRFEDWLTDNDPRDYLDYTYKRTNELDAMAAPIMPGEVLEVHVAGIAYRVRVERAL